MLTLRNWVCREGNIPRGIVLNGRLRCTHQLANGGAVGRPIELCVGHGIAIPHGVLFRQVMIASLHSIIIDMVKIIARPEIQVGEFVLGNVDGSMTLAGEQEQRQ